MSPDRILSCYLRYMQQRFCEERDLWEIWCDSYPEIVQLIIDGFCARFDPRTLGLARWPSLEALPEAPRLGFQRWIQLIQASVRTNYFVTDAQALSIKFLLPDGVIEIFMDHPDFQGVFLKRSMIARGGVRCSDRSDFRQECWQLMQTQVLKNANLVPSGAKGAFYCAPGVDSLCAYKHFVSALLDISDNVGCQGQIISPEHVRCYDGADYYNVIAADKGTAHYSDYANAIALERGYWLGDAFASGGKTGYNHKKLAITSRGVWAAVEHHLWRENICKDLLTMAGVGDMAGDIFGNGMLLHKNILLVAAFNYEAIFVDPNPDPLLSYQERERLFHTPSSRWFDYQAFSRGGAVYSRKESAVSLSPEARHLLGVNQESIHPDTLIRHILMLPVDILWMGGIGTFVSEQGEVVRDQSNDAVRISGNQVQARIIAEGANLGLTQKGRVLAARHGCALNIDGVDNGAGVNCSDHEVNIKILLNAMMQEGVLTSDERAHLLQEITQEVCLQVLEENHWQNFSISAACAEARNDLQVLRSSMESLISSVKERHLWNGYEGDFSFDAPLRPELAVLLSYAKILLKDIIHNLPLDHWGSEEVERYFPASLRTRCAGFIPQHFLYQPLKVAILSNTLINLWGPFALTNLAADTAISLEEAALRIVQLHYAFQGPKLVSLVQNSFEQPDDAMGLIALFQSCMRRAVFYTQQYSAQNIAESENLDSNFLNLRTIYFQALSDARICHGEGL